MTDNQSSNVVSNADANEEQSEYMLTTLDNPYSPFTDFDRWYAYDEQKGYHTCAYLARVTLTAEDLTEEDEDLAIAQAMDEIVEFNVLGNYLKVTKESWKDRSQSSPEPGTGD